MKGINQEADGSGLGIVNRSKTSRPHGHGLEKTGQKLVTKGELPDGGRVIVLRYQGQKGSNSQNGGRQAQDNLGVEAQFTARLLAVQAPLKIKPDGKTEPTHDDEGGNNQVDVGVLDIVDQADGPHVVKTCITEGRDR